jgi:hypothetical protein
MCCHAGFSNLDFRLLLLDVYLFVNPLFQSETQYEERLMRCRKILGGSNNTVSGGVISKVAKTECNGLFKRTQKCS